MDIVPKDTLTKELSRLKAERQELLDAFKALAVRIHMEYEDHRAFRGGEYYGFKNCQHCECVMARQILARYGDEA